MELEIPFKEGFLLFPPHGIIKKKSWTKKYCKLFKSSKHGIERLEVFDNEDDVNKNKTSMLLTLENCIKISPTPQKHQTNVFTVVSKTETQHFSAVFHEEMLDWLSAFQAVAFKDNESHDTPSSSSWQLAEDFEEDNELYCSSTENIFTVRVIPTPTSTRCGLNDVNYTLVVTQNALQLRSQYPHERLLYTWPFLYIRKYGYKSGLFTFEAGRKCGSGEGTFQLENKQNQEIFKCISHNMKSWRKSVCKDDPPMIPLTMQTSSPPGIVCGDGQFQAALNMEPGSRTPLPPSPTTSTNRSVNELAHLFEGSHIKLKPSKPPRKPLRSISSELINPQLYKKLSQEQLVDINPDESCSNYDSVVVRQDAWKTLGLDVLTHTENYRAKELSLPIRTAQNNNKTDDVIQVSRKIINQPTLDPTENYDTLQHIGSSQPVSMKSTSSSSLYQQITPQVTTPTQPTQFYDFNDYDVIEENFQEVRPADDSHQGYGIIRKNLPPKPPTHELDEYSVVIKPKKV